MSKAAKPGGPKGEVINKQKKDFSFRMSNDRPRHNHFEAGNKGRPLKLVII
jgi:hypothetical protein